MDPITSHPHRTHPRRRPAPRTGTLVALVVAAFALVAFAAPDAGAVIKGTAVPQGKYPWVVALEDLSGGQYCDGSIVAADLILTAAHCVVDTTSPQVRVAAGSVYLNDPAMQKRTVKEMRVHPWYSPTTDRYDIAVIILATPLTLGPRVQPIKLADKTAQATLIDAQSPSTVMGWGATSDLLGDSPNQLRSAGVNVIGDGLCNWVWGGGIDGTTMLCAGSWTKADACSGDSGGPLVVQDPATLTYYQAGVVSFGDTCDSATVPGVYADVANLAPFVINRGAGGTKR